MLCTLLVSPGVSVDVIVTRCGGDHCSASDTIFISIQRNDDELKYMAAHENKKHVYWTEQRSHWETFTIDVVNNNTLIRTCHGTYLSNYLDDGRLWQIHKEYADDNNNNNEYNYFPVRILDFFSQHEA